MNSATIYHAPMAESAVHASLVRVRPTLHRQIRSSIIIVNYNGGALLTNCLRSLRGCHQDTDEVILVDNASTDGSVECALVEFPAARLLRNSLNAGFGDGNNLGAQLACGEYLVFLNPDTEVTPGWLDPLIAALEADSTVGLVTAKILLLNNLEQINTCGNDMHFTGLTLCRGMGLDKDALATSAEVSAVSGAAFAMRRSLFEALGGFDGSFFLYMEDTDLSWRARLAGYRCLYVPTSIVYHRYSLRFGPQKTFYQERNRYLMLLKGMRWRTILVLAPALLLAEIVTWGFVLLREPGRLGNKLRAYAWIITHWQIIMRQRRRTQAQRRVADRMVLAHCTTSIDFQQTGSSFSTYVATRIFDPLFVVLWRVARAVIDW